MEEFGSETEVWALTADLVASRELPDRAEVQRRLRALLDLQADDPQLLAGPTLGNGDEFQLLARTPRAPLATLLRVADALHPVQLAFGIGLGALSTPLEGRAQPVGQLDGPCLHRARAALEEARRTGTWGRYEGPGDGVRVLGVNGLLALLGALRRGWTEKQARAVEGVRGGRLQKDLAAELGVAPSVVSERLKAAQLDAVLVGEAALEQLLGSLAEEARP